ncbi:hypothetical protein Trydic_g16722 [Trypoxylus dichotomus]
MFDWSIRNGYILLGLLYFGYPSVTSENKTSNHNVFTSKGEVFCGPLPEYMSEIERCIINGKDSSCPVHTPTDTIVGKYCSPFYSSNSSNYTIYTCKNGEWTTRSFCQAECGRKRNYAMPLIVGGQEVAKYEFPWVAAIYTGATTLCSGTIISPYHVVTVAHCFANADGSPKSKDKFIIRVGKHYREPLPNESSAQIRNIKKLIIHDQYRGGDSSFDIALMEVSEAFMFTAEVQPICIDWDSTYEDSVFVEDNKGIVTGWGYIEKKGPRSDVLRKIEVGLWNPSTCFHQLPYDFRIKYFTDDKFCAGYINASKSICMGDAGAGLVFLSDNRYYLRGIAAVMMMTPAGCESNHYALYTKVSYYLRWLMRNMMTKDNILMEFRTRTNLHEHEIGCTLPEHVPFGKFLYMYGGNYKVDQVVRNGTTIILKCDDENSSAHILRCINNEWLNFDKAKCNAPGTCLSLIPTSTESYVCTINSVTISCSNPPYGSEAKKNCKRFFTSPEYIYKCSEGKWTKEITSCVPECGTKTVSPTTLVIGGINATENEYPWVVAVYDSNDLQICGGTIVSKNFVLSAAHCFASYTGSKFNESNYSIVAGKHYRNKSVTEEGAQERKIKSLVLHPEYAGIVQRYRYDIALIQLESPFDISPNVRPACIDIENQHEDSYYGNEISGVVAGWGNTNPIGEPSFVLKKLVVPYVDRRKCGEAFEKDFARKYVIDDKICAGYKNNNTNICQGDSGGGLYFPTYGKYYIRGIASLTHR